MTNGPQDVADDARDERLRAALRHAPDGAVAPPQALSATIRAAAHAAVAPGPAPSWRRHWPAWQHAWRALGAPRPIWAGGAAAVLVSVLTINLWIGEPVPSAVESPAPVSVPAPATSAETETALQSTTRAVTDNTAPGAPPPQATGVAAQAPTATARPPAAVKPPAAPKAARGTAGERREATQAAPEAAAEPPGAAPARDATPPAPRDATPLPAPRSAAPLPAPHDAVETAVPATAGDSAQPRPVPVPLPMIAPGLVQTLPPATAVAGPSLGASPTFGPAPSARARTLSGTAPAALGEAARARSDVSQALAAKASAPALPPQLAAWLRAASVDTDDPAWPLSASRRRLLLMLQSAAGARWRVQAGPTPPDSTQTHALDLRDSQGQTASLRVEPGGARWIDPDGRHWFVPLDAATLQALSREF